METLVSNNEIKFVKSLSQKKFRDEYKLFVVEGRKLVAEARASGFHIERSYRVEDVGENAMSRLSQLSSPSPAIAVVRQFPSVLEDGFEVPGKGLFLALDGIRDPGNLGTILRTADWFGVSGVFASPDTVEVFNPKVVQATMGAIFRVRFRYAPITRLCTQFVEKGGKVYGTFLDGEDIYSRELGSGEGFPSLVVIGNEADGISPEVASQVTDRLYIPSWPRDPKGSESLNAAVAAAVTLAEFRRRNTPAP